MGLLFFQMWQPRRSMSGGVNWLMFAWIPHYVMGIPQVIIVCLLMFVYYCLFTIVCLQLLGYNCMFTIAIFFVYYFRYGCPVGGYPHGHPGWRDLGLQSSLKSAVDFGLPWDDCQRPHWFWKYRHQTWNRQRIVSTNYLHFLQFDIKNRSDKEC